MTKVVSGTKLADKITQGLKRIIKENNLKLSLAVIFIGQNPASQSYIKIKEKKAKELSINFKLFQFPKDAQEKRIIDSIKRLNLDKKINGIIVQLPIPKNLNKNKILNSISPLKDVDGLTAENLGSLFKGEKSLCPATPLGVMKIFENYNIDLAGKNIIVIGRSELVGLPLAVLLIKKQATVTSCNSKTKNLGLFTQKADIIISAAGKPNLVKADMVKKGAIVVDVGTTRTEKGIVGDVDFEKVKEKTSLITPVPGGVGPLTVIMLYNNLINLALKNREK